MDVGGLHSPTHTDTHADAEGDRGGDKDEDAHRDASAPWTNGSESKFKLGQLKTLLLCARGRGRGERVNNKKLAGGFGSSFSSSFSCFALAALPERKLVLYPIKQRSKSDSVALPIN